MSAPTEPTILFVPIDSAPAPTIRVSTGSEINPPPPTTESIRPVKRPVNIKIKARIILVFCAKLKAMKNEKYEIRPNQSIELLKELHILTRDGALNQDSRRKLKQIYHLAHFFEPLIKEMAKEQEHFTLVDHGAGKSYLGFILYDLFFKDIHNGAIIGVENRKDLVEKSTLLKNKLKFDRMNFLHSNVAESTEDKEMPQTIDIVTALHACDTATDDALHFAIKKKAKYIVVIPCCQAEVASVLKKNKTQAFSKTPLSEIWRHPLHTREFGSTLTNALRALMLESQGYQVTITEFIGLDHSLKNELILAKYTGQKRGNAKARILSILDEFLLTDLIHRFIIDEI